MWSATVLVCGVVCVGTDVRSGLGKILGMEGKRYVSKEVLYEGEQTVEEELCEGVEVLYEEELCQQSEEEPYVCEGELFEDVLFEGMEGDEELYEGEEELFEIEGMDGEVESDLKKEATFNKWLSKTEDDDAPVAT